MQYSFTRGEQATELAIGGRLTFADAQQFPKVLAELAKSGPGRWDIELGALDIIDSTGMSLFVHVYDAASPDGREVVMRNARGPVREALERAGFRTLFEFQ